MSGPNEVVSVNTNFQSSVVGLPYLQLTNSVSDLAMNLVVQSLFVPALSSASDNSRTHIISSHNPYNYFSA